MAKITDTRELVRKAYVELYAKHGSAPNIPLVQSWMVEYCGAQRNNNTISDELQQIRKEAERAYLESQTVLGLQQTLPEELVGTASTMLRDLFALAGRLATRALDDERAADQEKFNALREKLAREQKIADKNLEDALANVARAREFAREKEIIADNLQKSVDELRSAKDAMEAELTIMRDRRAEDRELIHRYEMELATLKQKLESERAEHAAIMERAGQAHQSEVTRRLNELDVERTRATKLQKELEGLKTKLSAAETIAREKEIRQKAEIEQAKGAIDTLQSQLAASQSGVTTLTGKIAVLEDRLEKSAAEQEEALRKAYMNGLQAVVAVLGPAGATHAARKKIDALVAKTAKAGR